MITLWHDYENGSELWWDSAQQRAARQWWSVFAIVFGKLLRDALLEVTADEADEFHARGSGVARMDGRGRRRQLRSAVRRAPGTGQGGAS